MLEAPYRQSVHGSGPSNSEDAGHRFNERPNSGSILNFREALMTFRSIAVVGFAAFFGSTLLAKPVPISPAAVPFNIGAVRAIALRDMINRVPNDGSVFGKKEGTGAVADVLREAGAPTDALSLGVDALLVRMPGRMVLIDTGLGSKVGGVLMQSLALAKVSPAEITDVLITHSHGDHVGGLSNADGKSAFPNGDHPYDARRMGIHPEPAR